MRYFYENVELSKEPMEFTRKSSKEVLQYAVGGLLYTPAINKKIAYDIIHDRIPHLASLCLCLEDAIGDEMVEEAEKQVKITLTELQEALKSGELTEDRMPLLFIRVREAKQMERLFGVCGKRLFSLLVGFTLPKFDTCTMEGYLDSFVKVQSKCKNTLYIMPIIESKRVMYLQYRQKELVDILQALNSVNEHVLNVRVGATDFSGLFAVRRPITNTIYDCIALNDCFADILNMFVHSYICSGPVWEYFDSTGEQGAWSEGLRKELLIDKLNGFVGKTCIHPSQLKYIQENYIVSYENYQDAQSILGMSDSIVGVKKGYGNNKMNEVKPHTSWAKKILGLASVYGVGGCDEV